MQKGLGDSSQYVATSNLEAIVILLVFTRAGTLTTLFASNTTMSRRDTNRLDRISTSVDYTKALLLGGKSTSLAASSGSKHHMPISFRKSIIRKLHSCLDSPPPSLAALLRVHVLARTGLLPARHFESCIHTNKPTHYYSPLFFYRCVSS